MYRINNAVSFLPVVPTVHLRLGRLVICFSFGLLVTIGLASCEKDDETFGLPGLPTYTEILEIASDSIVYLCTDDSIEHSPLQSDAWIYFDAPQGTYCSPRLNDSTSTATVSITTSTRTSGPSISVGGDPEASSRKSLSLVFDRLPNPKTSELRYRPSISVSLGLVDADSSNRSVVRNNLNRDTIWLDTRVGSDYRSLDPTVPGGYGYFTINCQWCLPAKYDDNIRVKDYNYSVVQSFPTYCGTDIRPYLLVESYEEIELANGFLQHTAELSFNFESCFSKYGSDRRFNLIPGDFLRNGRMGLTYVTSEQ